MDYKAKKKSSYRSRSSSRERNRHTSKRKRDSKRSYSSDENSDGSSNVDSSPERRHHKHRPKDRRKRSRSKDRSRKKNKRSHADSSDTDLPSSVTSKVKEIEKLKEEKRKQKELLKATETAEEKRLRRLAKKESKERNRKEQMGWDEEYMGFTNADNPFGDEQLMNTFVWKKKLEKEGKKEEDLHHLQKVKMAETKRELEKVKHRRLERERERGERDAEREQEQREKESEYYSAWEKQEDKFHLQQARLRSKIRIDDGRAKPIDLLAKYIGAEEEDDLTVEMHEPYTYLNGLTIEDLEDLLEDIRIYTELELNAENTDFWRDMSIITADELNKLRKLDPNSKDFQSDRREGINRSVVTDVASIFKGKTTSQLLLLQDQIKKKLKGGEGIDVGYWESLLSQLKAHMARSRLRERHQDQLKKKLYRLKQEQGIKSDPVFPIIKEEPEESSSMSTQDKASPAATLGDGEASTSQEPDVAISQESILDQPVKEEEPESILTEEDLMAQSYDEYSLANYSPKLIQPSDLEPDAILYDPADDMKRLEYARQRLLKTGKMTDDVDSELMKKAREGMNDDEATFSVQVPLEHKDLLWSDKYRPRKPRFFNRVHTGFEWNKYNQTHYDIDNPPPKIVQGYKFNIFYPDLIEKTQTPEYTITPCKDEKDFAVLRFRAGPPYEDIGFKIVNKEWECSWKRGFKCQFYNNIFQLWFHFKRYRYRR